MEIPDQNPRERAVATKSPILTATAPERTFDVPTQRTAPVRELDPDLDGELRELSGHGLPGTLLAPSVPVAPPTVAAPVEAGPSPRRRRGFLIVAVASVLALGGAGTTFAVAQRAEAAESLRQTHQAETVRLATVNADELSVTRDANAQARWAQMLADRAVALGVANASLEASRAALAGAPNADEATRGALQSAIDSASAVLSAVPTASVLSMQAAVGAIAAPQQAAAAGQAAWQVAETARLAAAQAAADAAAQARAAHPAKAAAKAPRTSSSAPAPAAAAAPASSIPEFSAGALGGAINAWRASQGLPAMSISRSASLVAQSGAMAEAGDIWDGPAKIVGYVQPGTAGGLVNAWANSPDHRAWMARTDKTAMQVGAVMLNNRLYGAVNFT